MVKQPTQKDLVKILPKLYNDLAAANLDTLQEYNVSYSFDPNVPETTVEKHIINQFCTCAASNLATQPGREYGFGSAEASSRATVLHTLSEYDLQYLPTNNLDCERDLAKFNKLAARSAACSNKKFKAKGMHDEMTLYKSESVNVDKATYYLSEVLDNCELQWVKQQKIVTKERLQQLCNAALKAEEYVNVLLHKCKKK